MQPTFLACTLHITADCGALPSFFLLSHPCIETSLHACQPLSGLDAFRFRKKGRGMRAMGPGGVAHLHVLETGMHSNTGCCTHAYNPTTVPAMLVPSRASIHGCLTGMRMNRT